MLQILKFGNSILKKENSQSMHMNKQYAPYALIGKQVHAWHSGCPNLSGNSPFIRAVAIAWYSIQSKTYQISILFNYVRSNRKVSTTWHGGSLNIIWRHINKIIFKNRWNQLKEIDCLTEHVSVEREKWFTQCKVIYSQSCEHIILFERNQAKNTYSKKIVKVNRKAK